MVDVLDIQEQEDGGAIITLNLTDEEQEIFIGVGVRQALKEAIEEQGGTLDE